VDCYPERKLYHLEHGNVCAKSERQRDSLRHAVYLRFLLHRAAERPCYGRLLQDRSAYDGCDPGANGDWHANSNAYSQFEPDTDADGNCNSYTYSDSDSDSYSYGHGNSDIYTYCYCYCYCYSDRHCYCYTDAYFHTETNPDAKRYGFAKAATDSASAPVGPGGERALGWNALSSTRWQK
jgi:hypothetical protein